MNMYLIDLCIYVTQCRARGSSTGINNTTHNSYVSSVYTVYVIHRYEYKASCKYTKCKHTCKCHINNTMCTCTSFTESLYIYPHTGLHYTYTHIQVNIIHIHTYRLTLYIYTHTGLHYTYTHIQVYIIHIPTYRFTLYIYPHTGLHY